MEWNEKFKYYFEKHEYSKDFNNEFIIYGKDEKYAISLITYKGKTFFYQLHVNQKNEEKITVFSIFSPMRYSRELNDISFKLSFRWIEKKYCFIFDDYS